MFKIFLTLITLTSCNSSSNSINNLSDSDLRGSEELIRPISLVPGFYYKLVLNTNYKKKSIQNYIKMSLGKKI